MNHKDMRNALGRIEPHVIPFAAPGIPRAVEEVFDAVRRAGRNPHLPDGQLDPAMLHPMGIGVDDDKYSFGSFGSFGSFETFGSFRKGLAEPEDLRIVRVVKCKGRVLLQGSVRMADLVDAGNQLPKT